MEEFLRETIEKRIRKQSGYYQESPKIYAVPGMEKNRQKEEQK